MKNSNKLILTCLIIVFVIPVLLAMTVKQKVKNNEFAYDTDNDVSLSAIRPYKIVILNGIKKTDDFLFRVLPVYANTSSIRFDQTYTSSRNFSFAQSGDTLWINYKADTVMGVRSPSYEYHPVVLHLLTPELTEIHGRNVEIYLNNESFPLADNCFFNLKNSRLIVGVSDDFNWHEFSYNEEDNKMYNLKKLFVNADNSNINIGKMVNIDNCDMALKNNSDFNMNASAILKSINIGTDSTCSFFAPVGVLKEIFK